ncbi:hypothetical protein BCR32DRAFT_292578 [Anaeromyces robustus]|uniref:MSP domain-containing protein n=1 Tax=Anaeromyces robustus TaxID=1754192 RepID=A0A1Y1X9Y6_9FUNG|nr:hypothetical protein BCR32DRAFT_292578 [Anaeromyces robustus]|eukprot:ORX82562.1 hypothetical protein BCR32DRAFT_292578 [Anaeromyces robustus]
MIPTKYQIIQRIRKDIKFLLDDYNVLYSFLYDDIWKNIVDNLLNKESFIRFYILKNLLYIPYFEKYLNSNSKYVIKLINIIENIIVSDEVMINRCYASIIIGKFLPIINDLNNSEKLIERIFKKLLFQFKSIYPNNLDQEILNDLDYFSNQQLVSRNEMNIKLMVYSLRSIGVFINTPPCLNDNFMQYFDLLLELILNTSSNKYLQIEALNIINNYYPRTNRGRLRIEHRFRKKINELSKKYELDIYQNISKKKDFLQRINSNNINNNNKSQNKIDNDDIRDLNDREDSNIIGGSMSEDIDNTNRILDDRNINEKLDKILFEKLNKFWSVWYPIVPDKILLRIPYNQVNEGYIFYRMKYLLEKTKIEGLETIDIYKNKGKQMQKDNVIKILKSNIKFPYPEKENYELIERKNFIKNISIIDTSIPPSINNIKKYVNEINDIPFSSIVESPYTSTLSFNLKYPILLLNKYPLTRNLFLHNSSRIKDNYFRIQVYPPEYFEVKPSFGLIPKNDYLLIKVWFKPQPYISNIKPEIFGYLKVRSLNGYSMERISLHAINYPSVKLSTNEINIGYCPEGYNRDFLFHVTNLTSTNIPISLLLENDSSTNKFIFPFLSDELQPYEKKMFKGKFLPTKRDVGKKLENTIFVMTGVGELLKIKICGFCDESIKIYKNVLNFGPTDIYSSEITKTLIIENIDKYNRIPVLLEATTNEIIINDNNDIILNPLEIKKVKIKFKSYYSGERSETIYVTCPFTNVKIINVTAFSGPALIFPVYKEIYLPTVKVNEVTTLDVPLINLTSKQTNCILYMPNQNNPFSLSIKTKKQLLEYKDYEDKNYKGIKIKFKGKETAIISIIFNSNLGGFFKIPLNLKVDKNNSIKLNNYFIFGSSYDDKLFKLKQSFFSRYLLFYKEKFNTLILNKNELIDKNKLKITDKLNYFKNHSNIFEIKTDKVTLNYNEYYKTNNIKHINLFNKTNLLQKYYLIISSPFIISGPVEGIIEANTMIDIPVTINVELIEDNFIVDKEFTIFGVLTIFDESEFHDPQSIKLECTINDIISVGIRNNISGILYPLYHNISKLSRTFMLRNKSPYNIRCNIYIKKTDSKLEKIISRNSYISKRILEEMKVTKEKCSQFTQNIKTLVLKPFQTADIEITYSLLNIRRLNVGFFIEYFISLTDGINIDPNDLKRIQNAEFSRIYVLKGYNKPKNITVSDNYIDFGCIPDNKVVTKSIRYVNENHDKYCLLSYVSYPFSLKDNYLKILEPNEPTDIHIKYLYRKLGPQYQSIICNSEAKSFNCLPIFGNIGICRMNINIFQPQMSYNIEKNHYIIESNSIDFGFLPFENKIIKTFYIKNNGTIDYIIEDINIVRYKNDNNSYECIIKEDNPNDNILYWEKNIDLNFKNRNLDKYEYDMDERIKKYKVKEQLTIKNFDELFIEGKSNENKSSPIEKLERPSIYPIILKPNQKINVQLLISPVEIGNFCSDIQISSCWETMETQYHKYKLIGSIQPIIKFKMTNYDFGIIPFQSRKSIKIEIKNEGSEKLHWYLKLDRTYYSVINNDNIEILENFEDDEIEEEIEEEILSNNKNILIKNDIEELSNLHPFTFFPSKGRLKPGYTQDVVIYFNPSLPNYRYRTILNIYTENMGFSSLELCGISSSSNLQCSDTTINFPANRIGKTSIKYFVLKNYSLMNLKFYIEVNNNVFSLNIDQGIIGVGEERTIKVEFTPKEIKKYKGKLRISSYIEDSELSKYTYINLTGIGGNPELTVDKDVIDFGITFLGYSNNAVINIHNHGEPDVYLRLKCNHPKINVDPECEDENGNIVAYANSITPIKFVYVPNIIETLNIHAFLIVVDDDKENIILKLNATVGIPKFCIYPESLYESLNFGTCLINKSSKKKFTIKNEGNTILKYNIKLNINQIKYAINNFENDNEIEINDDFKNVFYIGNSSGHLKINEEKSIIVIFKPKDLYEYKYDLIFSLSYKEFSIPLVGIGGKYDISIDIPSNIIDLGTCKINQTFVYVLPITNKSNMSVNYHVRPEPADGDYSIYEKEIHLLEMQNKITSKENYYNSIIKDRPNSSYKIPEKQETIEQRPETAPSYTEENKILKRSYFEKEKKWVYDLKSIGLEIVNPDGYCDQLKNTDIVIQYTPVLPMPINSKIRVYYGNEFKDITIVGKAANSILSLYDENHNVIFNSSQNSSKEVPTYNIGVISINTSSTTTFYLVNEGKFGIDFFIQPITINEYLITPQSGFVHIGESIPISIKFMPKTESVFKTNLKIFWENQLINVLIVGRGNVGQLNIYYPNINDRESQQLDFNMIPTNTSCEKNFFILNRGVVTIPLMIELVNNDFSICLPEKQKDFLEEKSFIDTTKKLNKNCIYNWKTYIKEYLLPGKYLEILVRYWARKTSLSTDIIKIKSVNYYKEIPVKGKGGSISIQHKGDLEFGDIANNYTFKKKVTIVNEGTIPCTINFEWMTLGHQIIQKSGSSHVILKDNYSNHDPRSPWARNMVIQEKEKNNEDPEWTAKDYWRMIKCIILYTDKKSEEEINNSKKNIKLQHNSINSDSVEKLHADDTSMVNSFALKYLRVQFSTQVKRRNLFYKLISQKNITSQSFIKQESYLKVNPPQIQLGAYGSKEIEVEINISTDDTFLGTLICRPDIPNSYSHEISLTAVTKSICIVCNDTSIINFFKQPIGHEETIKRTFTNVGEKNISFTILHDCPFLKVSPESGMLRVNQSVTIEFTFKPLNLSFLSTIVYFQPNCSNPVRLRMCGGGGYPKPSLMRIKKFDFGNCMIGKSIKGYLPIVNEGTAILHLSKFVLTNNLNFFKTEKWPKNEISIYPNQKYNLELMFYPKEENPPSGKLIIGTQYDSWEIELVGCGKESVIIFSKQELQFENCIIGNSYEQKVILKNIGDVNYPLSLISDENDKNDIKCSPENLVIKPYMEKEISVIYTPTIIENGLIHLKVESPYSVNLIPISINSGTVKLEFNMTELDYGIFEKNTRPCKILKIKNEGTLKTSFIIIEQDLKSLVRLSAAKGFIHPGAVTDIKVSLINNEIGKIETKLLIYTDLLSDEYRINITGVCEESIVNPEEFKIIEMGTNPTNTQVIRPLVIRNYGKFPLTYKINYSYPIKLSKKMGVVNGEDEHIVNVIWIPNGSYDLRSNLNMETNIGNFGILIRGKSSYPEISLSKLYIDYGVRAVSLTHTVSVELSNNGIVPLKWTAYQSRTNSIFVISKDSGSLDVKEKTVLDISFKPTTNTKYSSGFIIECKGRSYKELNVVGIGGLVNIELTPNEFNLGQCPCFNSKEYYFTIFNTSDLPLDLKFEYEAMENAIIILPESINLKIKEKKSCKIMILPKAEGNFKTTLSIITITKIFKYPVSGCGYRMKMSDTVKDIVFKGKTILENYLHPWEKLSKIDDYDFWFNLISKGIKNDYNIIMTMIKLIEYKKFRNMSKISTTKNSIDFSKESIFDYTYRRKSENSITGLNSDRSIYSRNRRRSSFIPSRRISRSSFSSVRTNESLLNNSIISQKLEDNINKSENLNKMKVLSFSSHNLKPKEKEKSITFKNAIIKLNKNKIPLKSNKEELGNEDDISSVLTTYNYDEYMVKTFDGRMVYNRNGPLINNFFKQFNNNNNNNNNDNNNNNNKDTKIKSILKKSSVIKPEYKNEGNNDEIENNLLVKMKQDDINNDLYIEIENEREKNVKKRHFEFSKMKMINENDEIEENIKTNNIEYPKRYNDNNNYIEYTNNNTTENDNNNIFDKENNSIIDNKNNDTDIDNENKNPIENENNDTIIGNEDHEYNREDLLKFLNSNNENNNNNGNNDYNNNDNYEYDKEKELSNEEYMLQQERSKHDQELLTKIESYQDLLNIANISAIEIVDLIEHNINVRPIIQNIMYNIHQNITLYTDKDIKKLEEMFIVIKLFKSKPTVVINNKYDKIIDKIINVPYPNTKVQCLKELLKHIEPNVELDISPVITRPHPFLFKRVTYEDNIKKE